MVAATLCASDALITVRWFIELVQFQNDAHGLTISNEQVIDCVTDQPLDLAVQELLARNPGWSFAGAWEPDDDCPF